MEPAVRNCTVYLIMAINYKLPNFQSIYYQAIKNFELLVIIPKCVFSAKCLVNCANIKQPIHMNKHYVNI